MIASTCQRFRFGGAGPFIPMAFKSQYVHVFVAQRSFVVENPTFFGTQSKLGR